MRRLSRQACAFIAVVLSLITVRLYADHPDGDALPGHSVHGESFDDGPRQAAHLMGNTGGPTFPVTTAKPEAAKFIDQGVGQLHGFWYYEAERSFRQAAAIDPECAMAYWGMAMSNINNESRAVGLIRTAMKYKGNVTDREKRYIDLTSAYLESSEKSRLEKKAADKAKADAAEKAKSEVKPAPVAHPAAQPPATPDKAAEAKPNEPAKPAVIATEPVQVSQELDKISSELDKVRDALKKQGDKLRTTVISDEKKVLEAKEKAAKKTRLEERLKAWESLVLDYPEDTHAAAWYVLQLWHDRNEVPMQSYAMTDALLEKILTREPFHPAHHYRIHMWDEKRPKNALDAAAKCGQSAPNVAHMWHMPGHIYTKMKRFHDAAYHQEASARVDHRHMMEDGLMPYQIHNYAHNNEWLTRNLLPIGHANDALRISKNLLEIPRHPKQNAATEKNSAAGYGRERLWETLTRNELWAETIAASDAGYFAMPTPDQAEDVRLHRYLCVAYAALGQTDAARGQLTLLESMQSALDPTKKPQDAKSNDTEKPVVCATPVKLDKRELEKTKRRLDQALRHARGAIAAANGDHKAALELLAKVDDLPKTQLARAAMLAGDHERAVKLAREAFRSATESVAARATLVETLKAKGDIEEAKKEFAALRKVAATADLTLPAIARLADFAKECEYPTDWRLPLDVPTDIGVRPALDELGPLAWSPATAANWSLVDKDGKTHALNQDYAGKPVVVLFYLGFGCIHCAEQLNTFGPMAKEYEAAGIKLVAISTDTQEELKKTLENAKQEGGFPFPLLSNSEKNVFKQYRCFDDFEKRAMHGTILIDAKGKIRWQDIGPEPFADAKFLLGEAQRLLKLPE